MTPSDVLADAGWVQAHLDDPRVVPVEVDNGTGAYHKGHLKGAVKLDWAQDLQDPETRGFVDESGFQRLLSARGISNDDTVILYGGNNNWLAAYAYWYFKVYGHHSRWPWQTASSRVTASGLRPGERPLVQRREFTGAR
jgi:thiosulfate/3-mercaptopyruvate sulfurtransferase